MLNKQIYLPPYGLNSYGLNKNIQRKLRGNLALKVDFNFKLLENEVETKRYFCDMLSRVVFGSLELLSDCIEYTNSDDYVGLVVLFNYHNIDADVEMRKNFVLRQLEKLLDSLGIEEDAVCSKYMINGSVIIDSQEIICRKEDQYEL